MGRRHACCLTGMPHAWTGWTSLALLSCGLMACHAPRVTGQPSDAPSFRVPKPWYMNVGFKCAETSRVLSSVCGLTGLRSLRLDLRLHPDNMTLDAVRPHATSLAQLGALTVLTRLHLELSDCYEPAGDSWDKQQEDGEEHEAWEEVREVQRTSLLSALRCMPQLQDLSCRTLWLRPSEAASLAALTSLTLGRLLAPQDGMAAGVAAPASGALPPQLRTLSLRAGASPSVLAALQPPPSLTELDLSSIRFGTTDVSRGCKVLPEAVQAFGEAVRLVMHYLPKCRQQEQRRIQVVAACGDDLMMPPDQAGCEGHAGWIRQLAPLGAWLTGLQIRGIRLTHGDLQCLVSELPNLQASLLLYSGCSAGWYSDASTLMHVCC